MNKNSNKLKLVIMQGIPGSGKSYTANEILKNADNGVIYSTDDFWYNDSGEYVFVPRKIGEAHDWNKDRTREAMKNNIPLIIIDNTNTTPRDWHPYEQMAKQNGYVVEFARPTSRWWKEVEPHIKAGTFTDEDVKTFYERNTHGVPFDVIKKMMERFTFA